MLQILCDEKEVPLHPAGKPAIRPRRSPHPPFRPVAPGERAAHPMNRHGEAGGYQPHHARHRFTSLLPAACTSIENRIVITYVKKMNCPEDSPGNNMIITDITNPWDR